VRPALSEAQNESNCLKKYVNIGENPAMKQEGSGEGRLEGPVAYLKEEAALSHQPSLPSEICQ